MCKFHQSHIEEMWIPTDQHLGVMKQKVGLMANQKVYLKVEQKGCQMEDLKVA